MLPMFTTVDPAGLRADLQLVSGVQSEGKLYEWLSMARFSQEIDFANELAFQMLAHGPSLESSAPPLGKRLIWAREKGGDWERTHGQGPLIYSRSVIMWPALRETEIDTERQTDRQTES